jgi:hypothetical protein
MGVLPIVSILIEFFVPHSSHDLLFLIGKWFVFWSVGIRRMLAGVRQIANPTFTADAIFGVKEKGALTIVQELGFGNLSIGLLAALPDRIVPAAITGELFYGGGFQTSAEGRPERH